MHHTKSETFDWAFLFQWMMATTVGWILGKFLFPNIAFMITGLAIGILQWLVLTQRLSKVYWWAVFTAIGWTVGAVINFFVFPAGYEFLSGVILGITTGLTQWLFLRKQVFWAGWWIIVMIISWTTGLALLPGVMLTGVMVGLISGFALELLLRYPKPTRMPDQGGEDIDR
jgi:hypothetical protein